MHKDDIQPQHMTNYSVRILRKRECNWTGVNRSFQYHMQYFVIFFLKYVIITKNNNKENKYN